jgi:hypothetical protein
MASLIGTTVATNYQRVTPTTQMGIRALRIVKVALGSDTYDGGNYTLASSDYSLAVRTIQTYFETWAVFAPATDGSGFCFICSDDTAQDSNTGTHDLGGYGQCEAAVVVAVGSTCTMTTVSTIYPGLTI